MTTKEFKKLHQSNDILHIGNVWDVKSALTMEKLGYKVLGTSSSAIADSLGYEDGEEIKFDELLKICKQILSKVNIPLSVDIEGGYSRDTKQIIDNIISLANIGVVGINIEDSIVVDGKRKILQKEKFRDILEEIKENLAKNNIDIFINVRVDSFILDLENSLEDVSKRVKIYEPFSDGIFIPCIVDIKDIEKIVSIAKLPLNIMAMPNLEEFSILKKAGVTRISQGSFVYNNMINHLENKLNDIKKEGDFKSLF